MTTLDGDTILDIRLSAICTRRQYDTDPTTAIAELRLAAGDRVDILARVAGLWAGYHEGDPHVAPLVAALAEIDGASDWIPAGRERTGRRGHSTPPAT